MNNLLRLEELAQFLACLLFLSNSEVAWWAYALLLIGPDVGMLGYIISRRVGAITYNLLHHKGLALSVVLAGIYFQWVEFIDWFIGNEASSVGETITIAGLILYGHASMDRIFGYGLKFGDNFHHTHLGWIGKGKVSSGESKIGQRPS
jgi:hypothetical protein